MQLFEILTSNLLGNSSNANFNLFVSYSIFSVTEPPTVQAVAGDKAAVPCNVPTPLKDDQASLILWYKVGIQNPIYTLDIRNIPFKGAKHFPSIEMGSRAHFNVSIHPPVLILNPVEEEDQGDYKCRVDLRRSRTLIIHSMLRVIGNKIKCLFLLFAVQY